MMMIMIDYDACSINNTEYIICTGFFFLAKERIQNKQANPTILEESISFLAL